MDPNTALQNCLRFLEFYRETEPNPSDIAETDLEEFINNFEALNDWLSNGGFLPAKWNK